MICLYRRPTSPFFLSLFFLKEYDRVTQYSWTSTENLWKKEENAVDIGVKKKKREHVSSTPRRFTPSSSSSHRLEEKWKKSGHGVPDRPLAWETPFTWYTRRVFHIALQRHRTKEGKQFSTFSRSTNFAHFRTTLNSELLCQNCCARGHDRRV